jgi:hypothetical protein
MQICRTGINMLVAMVFLSAVAAGASYEMGSDVVSECGGRVESQQYSLEFSIAQPATGMSSSSSYVEFGGFWYPRMPWDPFAGIADDRAAACGAAAHHLFPNHPNPFDHTTVISYFLPAAVPVRLVIHNTLGQMVGTLVDGMQGPGRIEVRWQGRAESGEEVASGIYFCTLQAGDYSSTQKLLVLR